MFFTLFIVTRLLFVASAVFLIGYVFGNFSKSKTLTRITKVATILTIVLFIGTNAFIFRGGPRGHAYAKHNGHRDCAAWQTDSTYRK